MAITVRITSDPMAMGFGVELLDTAFTVTTPVGKIDLTTISQGSATAITIPSGVTAALLVPPAANAIPYTLKGITGDTGIPLHLTAPTLIGLGSGATMVIQSPGAPGPSFTLKIVWL